MKLKSFKIQSYKSCINTEIPINDGLTCLIGVNGSGKTNILNGILLLNPTFNFVFTGNKNIPNMEKCNIELEVKDESDKNLNTKGKINYRSDENNIDFKANYQFQWNFKEFIHFKDWFDFPFESFNGFNLKTDFKLYNESVDGNTENQNSISLHFNYGGSLFNIPKELNRESISTIIEKISLLYNFFSNINYYSASEFSDPSKSPVSIEFEESRKPSRNTVNNSHEKFIIDLYELSFKNDTDYKSYLNLVNKSGIGLIDNITFTEVPLPSQSYEVKSVENIKIKNGNRKLIVPNFQIDGYNLSPNQLSEGTFRTLALIFYILNDDSKLLLIEEPEVCVHHGLLSSIIELIKSQSKHKQIIISTHSDFVLDQLEPENIVLVKRDDKKGTTSQSLTKSMSKNDYKALRNYLNETGNLGEYWKEGGFDNE